MSKLKVLITGGCNFIGLALIEALNKEDNEIIILDDSSTNTYSNINRKLRVFNISTTDKNCETIFKDTKFDVVIHIENKMMLSGIIEEKDKILQSNNIGLINILYFSHKYQVGKFIILSSYHVYGKQEFAPIKEDYKPNPIEDKGFNELIRELYCEQYRKEGLDTVILRVGEVYGPKINYSNNIIGNLLSLNKLEQNFVLESNNQRLDYIFIGELVEEIKIRCENYIARLLNISTGTGFTSHEILEIFSEFRENYLKISIKEGDMEQIDYILDNKKAIFDLEWYPKYGLQEGIRKTILWQENNIENNEELLIKVKQKKKKINLLKFYNNYKIHKNYKDVENILLFLIFAVSNYYLRYKLGIKIDLFILYVIIINLIYGFKQGSLSVVLSIITNIWFKLRFEDMKTFNLINDPSNILYSTMYFVIGIMVGNTLDKIKMKNEILASDLDDVITNMEFTYDIYEKSIQIKNILQDKIENYDDSFQKTLNTIITLEKTDNSNVLIKSIEILNEILKIDNAFIYSLNEDEEHIDLLSLSKLVNSNNKININENEFLKSVVHGKKIFINKSFEKSLPRIAAPLFKDDKVVAVIFIYEIDFKLLNYQFINTLKVLIYLISNRISEGKPNIKTIQDI